MTIGEKFAFFSEIESLLFRENAGYKPNALNTAQLSPKLDTIQKELLSYLQDN
jgi:hypothetical protein